MADKVRTGTTPGTRPAMPQPEAERDHLARCLEWGLVAFVILIPLPFGAVGLLGRISLETAALLLGLLWLLRSLLRPTRLPSRSVITGMIGLVILATLQIVPAGEEVVAFISPKAAEIREMAEPPAEIMAAEESLIGIDPTSLDRPLTLSVDPGATASALRTGIAFCLLLLVSTTVASVRGGRRLAAALLISASFQGLYGILVLASGHEKIWHITKKYYLSSATGTYVNRNHFACFLAMATVCGLALILDRHKHKSRTGRSMVRMFGGENSKNLLLGLLLIVGLAGLLASLSRAGIALGLLAITITMLAAGRAKGLRKSIVIVLLLVAVAVIPLLQLGSDELIARYARSAKDMSLEGGRPTVWLDTLHMAASYPLCGAGYGTFAAAYPLFRSAEVRLFFKHAHNDLVQALAEGGIIGALFLAMLLLPIVSTIVRAIGGAKGTLAVGFAAGLTAFLLHSLIDFNLHIPANAATASILAGMVLGLPWKSRN